MSRILLSLALATCFVAAAPLDADAGKKPAAGQRRTSTRRAASRPITGVFDFNARSTIGRTPGATTGRQMRRASRPTRVSGRPTARALLAAHVGGFRFAAEAATAADVGAVPNLAADSSVIVVPALLGVFPKGAELQVDYTVEGVEHVATLRRSAPRARALGIPSELFVHKELPAHASNVTVSLVKRGPGGRTLLAAPVENLTIPGGHARFVSFQPE